MGNSHKGVPVCLSVAAGCLVAMLVACSTASAQNSADPKYRRTATPADNAELQAEIESLTGAWIAASVVGLVPFPPNIPIAADVVATGLDVRLKHVPAVFTPPPDRYIAPEGCNAAFFLTKGYPFQYQSWLGASVFSDTDRTFSPNVNFGFLGYPQDIYHFNSDVDLLISGPSIPGRLDFSTGFAEITLGQGSHDIKWTAETRYNEVSDLVIPLAWTAVSGAWSKYKYGNEVQRLASQGIILRKEVAKAMRKKFKEELLENARKFLFQQFLAFEKALIGADAPSQTRAASIGNQRIVIQDDVPVEISFTDPADASYTVEALGIGGTLLERVEEDLAATVAYSDGCGRPLYLTREAPVFLPVNQVSEIVWTVTDRPPGQSDEEAALVYSDLSVATATLTQSVIVQDTQAPLLLAPDSQTFETDEAFVDLTNTDLGVPKVVDLADMAPTVVDDRPASVPVGERVGVTWTATDASNNADSKIQWITAKSTSGNTANTAPEVGDESASVLTSELVEIVLSGTDPDVLPSRLNGQVLPLPDRLRFEIVDLPENGSLEAPLRPFFIEDFRISATGQIEADGTTAPHPLGQYLEGFIQTPPSGHADYLQQTICADTGSIPVDFVYQPGYVHIDDRGYYYVVDSVWACGTDTLAIETPRISVWDSDRRYLDAFVPTDNGINGFYGSVLDVATNGELAWSRVGQFTFGGSASERVFVMPQFDADGVFTDIVETDRLYFSFSEGETIAGFNLFAILKDPLNDVIYTNDGRGIRVETLDGTLQSGRLVANGTSCFFDGREPFLSDGQGNPLCADSPYNDPTWQTCAQDPSRPCRGFRMDTDSQGNLYVVERAKHRIHKFEPSGLNANGQLELGEYIGWMGSCSANVAPWIGCDEARGVTRGFSCTDQVCLRAADAAGTEPGQFKLPGNLVVDPKDNFYVADVGNQRVQRFGEDGTFAGQAVSTGSGINQGDSPNFILGNFGDPRVISVNSSTLLVIDTENQSDNFVHSFKTLPFFPIDAAEGNPLDADSDGFVDNSVVVKYRSDFNFPGASGVATATDTFSYRVNDGLADSNVGTVTVDVSRAFRPPYDLRARCYLTADRQAETNCYTEEDSSLLIELSARDPDGVVGFDGLDTLTYTANNPGFGQLTLLEEDGATAFYRYDPEKDAFGTDRFSFSVDDGAFTVASDELEIVVLGLPDAPTLTMQPNLVAGRGFPSTLSGFFTDPDDPTETFPTMTVTWADGVVEAQGELVENPPGSGQPEATGPLLTQVVPGSSSLGQISGTHVYSEAFSDRDVIVCLDHEPSFLGVSQTCEPTEISVIEAASIALGIDASTTEPQESEVIDLTFTVTNQQPEGWLGLDVFDTTLEIMMPDGFIAQALPGDCRDVNDDGSHLACDVGQLMPGQIATYDIPTVIDPEALPEIIKTLTAAVTHSVPNFPSEELEALTFVVDWLDTDGDGMPDAWEERFGLDPDTPDGDLDADAERLINLDEYAVGTDPTMEDTDSDGLTDAEEVANGTDPLVDSVAPAFTAPDAITVDSTGPLTAVDFGTVIGTDAADGDIEAVADNPGPYAPGTYTVTWTVEDSAGNVTTDEQVVNVIPRVNFPVDQDAAEGGQVTVRVELNGNAVDYPVQINYSVGGDAINPDDHNASASSLLIETGTSAEVTIDIVDDGTPEGVESITLTMGETVNAVPGTNTVHTITIVEDNVAPRASIRSEQGGRNGTRIAADGGTVTVTATVRDANAGDSHTYDWSRSDPSLLDPADFQDESFTFDPGLLLPGVYRLVVDVFDNGVPIESAAAMKRIKIVASHRLLPQNRDRDGDGVMDRDDGHGDVDDDGVPDYLDANNAFNLLLLSDDGTFLETATGFRLRLGELAFANGAVAGLSEGDVGEDVAYSYPSGVSDFEVTDIGAGDRARVVVPLTRGIPPDAAYRKNVLGNWSDFVVDGANEVASAPGRDGACPEAGSNEYLAGLAEGDSCIQLLLEDGGPNDSDAEMNGIIADPGGLGVPVAVTLVPLAIPHAIVSSGTVNVPIFSLHLSTESGGASLNALTLQAAGSGRDQEIVAVKLFPDTNGDGTVDNGAASLATGTYDTDNGTLELRATAPIALPIGATHFLVTYDF